MHKSIKLFFAGIWKSIYARLSFISLAYSIFKPQFPDISQKVLNMTANLGFFIFVVLMLAAAVSVYHNLRMKRLAELYEYLPEAKRDKVFKMFYKLLREGQLIEHSNTFRRQEWDKDVLNKISTHCKPIFKTNYLINTRGTSTNAGPLQDAQYSKALEQIKDYLDNMFDIYTK
ncbi:hypothetical protein JYT87_00870 [Nitrospira defluvii]|nr:hypothetical protein [Nitrospira defluvii]